MSFELVPSRCYCCRGLRVFGLCTFASSDAWNHSHLRVLNPPIYAQHLLGRHLAALACRSRVVLASLHAWTAGDRNPSTTVPSLVSILLICHATEEERLNYSVCVEYQPGVAPQTRKSSIKEFFTQVHTNRPRQNMPIQSSLLLSCHGDLPIPQNAPFPNFFESNDCNEPRMAIADTSTQLALPYFSNMGAVKMFSESKIEMVIANIST